MEFRILGPLEIRREAEALNLGGPKQRALLGILLIHANHVVSVERLSELLWPDAAPADPGHVIEVHVSQLRRALEPTGPPYRTLVRKSPGYALYAPQAAIDAVRFQNLLESSAGLPPQQAAAQLEQALSLWRGPALADFANEGFAISEAARLNELRLHALEERIDADLALGRHGQLIGELRALVQEHPLRERLCGQLMLALYRAGRQAEASDVYQATREQLVDQLGMEPGPETQSLLKRILQQDPDLLKAESARAASLPTGTLTFLLTDIEGSTDRWERNPIAMRSAMETHDTILNHQISAHNGKQVESGREGDSILAAFAKASDAVGCAVEIQRQLAAQAWPEGVELRVRIALHSGEAELRSGHYFGRAVYRCARLMAIGHGGQVLVSQATHDLALDALTAGITLRDLGSHRLRDLQRPERVFQVVAEGVRADFPPLRSLDPQRHNLPVSTTSFVGRGPERAELKERLESGRLLTLVGSAGTGKTRLALEVAADLLDAFPDGVWLVELAPISDPSLLPRAVAETLGVHEEAGQPIAATVRRWLRAKSLLLVLDNCEHLVTAAAEVADRMLRDCPAIRILATSREALRVTGEMVMRVGPLPEADGVLLFAERSTVVQPAFRLSAENRQSVVEICRRVEGIPLAIELAAGRARMMTPDEIQTQLKNSFRVLGGGARAEEGRHETLQTAIDWSYRLLSEPEKLLLRRLSVFTGGFTLEAAQRVCGTDGGGPVLDVVGQLVDKSLVSAQAGETRVTRYSLLESVREYGRARLIEHGELDAMQQHHAEHFIDFAEKAAESARRETSGPVRARFLKFMGDDIDNMRAVFDAPGVPADAVLRLAVAMEEYWDARGEYSEARMRLQSALQSAFEPTDTRAWALLGVAIHAAPQGDQQTAIDYCSQSLALFRKLGHPEGQAHSLQHLAQFLIGSDRHVEARASLNEALRIATEHGFQHIRSLSLWRLGMIDLVDRDMPAAREHILASLELAREQSDVEMIALSLLMLGNISLWQGSLDEALSYLSEGLEIWRPEGNPRSIANFIESLAAHAAAVGKNDRALRLGGAAEALRERGAVVASSPFHREFKNRLEALRRDEQDNTIWSSGRTMSRDQAIDYALEERPTLRREVTTS